MCAFANSNHGCRICFDSSDFQTMVRGDEEKAKLVYIKAFASEKDIFKLVSLVATYGPHAQFIVYAIIKV